MARPHRTVLLRLQRDNNGAPLHYIFHGGPRNGRSVSSFVGLDCAAALGGADEAWAEIERVASRPWPFYRVLRRVPAPG